MERPTAKKAKRFTLEDSPVVAENERILGGQSSAAPTPAPIGGSATTAAPSTKQPAATAPAQPDAVAVGAFRTSGRKAKANKTENGITVYVPMEYYERLTIMKMRTGIPLKDLALQAVIEFVDRHKMD